MTIYHNHHIVPRHMGGTNDPSNLVRLTVEEHAEAHRKLYEEHDRWQDYVAWHALSGQLNASEASRVAGDIGRKKGTAHLKGKTYEEAYGDKSEERRQSIIDSNKRRKGIKYKSMNHNGTSNHIKVSCLGCCKQTSIAAFGKHKKKCF